jgi:ribulose-phosphate 3-epimerase
MIEAFAKAGATMISFHPEASQHVDRSIELIKQSGCKAGLVLNPATSLSVLDYVLEKLDFVILMSVNPGFGGQKFIPNIVEKTAHLKGIIDEMGLETRIEVDGGINKDTIRDVYLAGADMFVAGSAIFGQEDYTSAINALTEQLK